MPTPRRTPNRPLLVAVLASAALVLIAAGSAAAADPLPSETPVATGTPAATVDPTATPAPSTAPEPSPSVMPSPSEMPPVSPDPSTSPDPSPAPDPSPSPDPGGWTGEFNLYRSGAWVRQYWDYTCTAASTQTMLNIILGRSNRSLALQQRIIRYARNHDTLRSSRGSDPAGWAKALTRFGGGAYGWRTFATRSEALRHAATRMVATGKPVGLLVWRGRHAWTMTGFTSATDPSADPAAVITGIYVAPPLRGVDPRPNAYLPASSLRTFARYRESDGLRTWVGRWVVVAP